jgi:hypothetical protein
MELHLERLMSCGMIWHRLESNKDKQYLINKAVDTIFSKENRTSYRVINSAGRAIWCLNFDSRTNNIRVSEPQV